MGVPNSAMRSFENKPFVLTGRKLSRIVEVAKERAARQQTPADVVEKFSVDFKNGKEIVLSSLDEVLRLDNSATNPVSGISYESRSGGYWRMLISFSGSESVSPSARIVAHCSDATWLQETMGAIEEQVERTLQGGFISFLKSKSLFFGAALVASFLALALSLLGGPVSKGGIGSFSTDEVGRLAELRDAASNDTEKMNFIFEYLSAALPKEKGMADVLPFLQDARTYLVGVPLLLAIVCSVAAIIFLYPPAVFAWGDGEEKYENVLGWRKVVWYGVLGSLGVGVLGNIFFAGVAKWL